VPRAGSTDDADDAIRTGRGLVHEHALLAREVGFRLHERASEQRPVGCRSFDVPPGERELESKLLKLEQLAGREPRRAARHLARLEKLDAGVPR
jgi:hypothetical protein